MVDGVFSKEESVDSGVPQGTVLGPLLFFLSISDIPNNLSADTTIRLLADDWLVLYIYIWANQINGRLDPTDPGRQ